jgi:RNA polymerase sigma-70 factor (ECF subfamily)
LDSSTVNPPSDAGRGVLERALDLNPIRTRPARVLLEAPEFQRLYDAHAGPILGYLAAVAGKKDVAEDLVQETFVRLLTRPLPPMDDAGTRRYLFRIATNLLRDRWRSGDATPYAEPAEPSHADDLDTPIAVRAALARLKPRERELLWLAYVEGMDHAEIAAATGLQRLSVRIALYRARRKAAELLSPPEPTGRTQR